MKAISAAVVLGLLPLCGCNPQRDPLDRSVIREAGVLTCQATGPAGPAKHMARDGIPG